MKKIIFLSLSIFASSIATSAFADGQTSPVTREQFIDWCDHAREKASLYVAGFNDATQQVERRLIRASRHNPSRSNDYEKLRFRTLGAFCAPPSIPLKQYVDVSCRWMKERLDKSGQPAASLLPDAYRWSFPCHNE